MADDLIRQGDPADHEGGFFGSNSTDPIEAPTVARDASSRPISMEAAFPPRDVGLSLRRRVGQLGPGMRAANVTGVTLHLHLQ